ncbi:MAG: C40 family peptidase [Anaerolineaceae bacterium]|nr:C40 family peptidase [Anaerolineaceae bacterium]
MKEQIETALRKLGQRFLDARLHIFDLNISKIEQDRVTLSGRVLETKNLEWIIARLMEQFPQIRFDTRQVRILHQPDNPILTVGVNLTDLNIYPSFNAERINQACYGERLEILEQQRRWAFVRQEDGYLSYVYLPYLTGKVIPPATHLVIAPVAALYAAPDPQAPVLTRVLGGTAVHLCVVQDNWAQIDANERGWIQYENLRALDGLPVSPQEIRQQMVNDARCLIGAPYTWGGISANGIDCSGFARLVHRWAGIFIPRDADLQFRAGKPVEAPYQPGDLLFFGEPGGGKRIAHVGISLGGWEIIHASLERNGVYTDSVQITTHLWDNLVSGCSFVPGEDPPLKTF